MNIKYSVYVLFLITNFVQAMQLPPAHIENPNVILTFVNNTDQDYTFQSSTMTKPYPIPAYSTKKINIGTLFIDALPGPNYAKGKELTLSIDSKTSHKKAYFSYIQQGDNNRLFSGSLGKQQDIFAGNTIVDFNSTLDKNIDIILDIQSSTLNISKKANYLPIQIDLNNQSSKAYRIHFESTANDLPLPAHETIFFNPREYLHGAINIISFIIQDEKSNHVWIVKISDLKKDNKNQLTIAILNNKNERLTERFYILNPDETHEEIFDLVISITITGNPSNPIFIGSISENKKIR